MTLPELLIKLRGEDIFPIRVEEIPERSNDLAFIGSLSEFIEAAKALQSPVVFVSTTTLSEDHFLWNNPDADDESIDLCRVVPPLKEFKSRVGEDGNIDLSVPGPKCSLTLAIVEDWFSAFVELHSQARQLIQQASLEKHTQEEAAEEAKTQHLLRNLRGLIADKDFVQLPTQLAMREYALDDFPELETLKDGVLKVEIQSLKARIDAQGLRRK